MAYGDSVAARYLGRRKSCGEQRKEKQFLKKACQLQRTEGPSLGRWSQGNKQAMGRGR